MSSLDKAHYERKKMKAQVIIAMEEVKVVIEEDEETMKKIKVQNKNKKDEIQQAKHIIISKFNAIVEKKNNHYTFEYYYNKNNQIKKSYKTNGTQKSCMITKIYS